MTTERKLPPSRTADQFVLRLPEGLRERIAASAEAGGRSMNAEFVRRIEQSFESPTEDADKQIEVNAVLKGLRDTIAEVARNDNERDVAVRAMGRDLHMLCREALPIVDDEGFVRNSLQMLGGVGVSMQAGDLVDAQAQLRALYYLAAEFAKR